MTLQIYRLILLATMLCVSAAGGAQVLLQLEKYNNPRAEKYYLGDRLIYKHADYPDEWRKEKIQQIIPVDNKLITSASYLDISEIAAVRTYNPGIKAAGSALKVFGAAWLLYGGIAAIGADFDFGPDTAVIGVGSLASGWLLEKLFYKNTYKMGTRHRVRILDISWQDR